MYQCTNPLIAVSLFKGDKRHMKFISSFRHDWNFADLFSKYGRENVFTLPCGHCEACRRNYSYDWSIRCEAEARTSKFNYFITLTYSDDFVNYASKKDFDKFLDRLEGVGHKNKFKYFSCFEKGKLTNRPHWHVAIFSDFALDLFDETILNGYFYYHSNKILQAWPFGLHNVAPFEFSCARYIAKYTDKQESKIYMSRNIGKKYFLEHYEEIIKDDFKLYFKFNDRPFVNIPVAFGRWFLENNCPNYDVFKLKRSSIGSLFAAVGFKNSYCKDFGEYLLNSNKHVKEKLESSRKEKVL